MGNVRRFPTETDPTSRINFMITFNALSITSFDRFLMDIYDLRCEFNEADSFNRIPMMINYLRWPSFQNVQVLPLAIRQEKATQFNTLMHQHTRNTSPNGRGRFYLEEIDQIERLGKFMCGDLPDLERQEIDFTEFFREYDRRRGTNFHKTFPELVEFFETVRPNE
jgi:hypothetical protein